MFASGHCLSGRLGTEGLEILLKKADLTQAKYRVNRLEVEIERMKTYNKELEKVAKKPRVALTLAPEADNRKIVLRDGEDPSAPDN